MSCYILLQFHINMLIIIIMDIEKILICSQKCHNPKLLQIY